MSISVKIDINNKSPAQLINSGQHPLGLVDLMDNMNRSKTIAVVK